MRRRSLNIVDVLRKAVRKIGKDTEAIIGV